jgi:guanylate kinase
MEGRALLFVGPDGSGRNTLAEAIGITLQIPRVISYNTRPKRDNETSGKKYHFISNEEFTELEKSSEFVEAVETDGNRYGIKVKDCEKLLRNSGSFFAVVNPKGCEIFKQTFDKTLTIFVHADPDILIERQKERGDTPEDIERHMSHYEEIMEYQSSCDIVIANYDLASTAQELTTRIEEFLNITHHPDSKY